MSKYFLLSEGDVRPEVAASLPLSGGLSLSLSVSCDGASRSKFRRKKMSILLFLKNTFYAPEAHIMYLTLLQALTLISGTQAGCHRLDSDI